MLAVYMMRLEIACFAALAVWMMVAVWKFSRGDRRMGDTARLVILGFSLFIIYRDWRILYVDNSDEAKVVMCVLGITLCGFTALAARAYGRGVRLS